MQGIFLRLFFVLTAFGLGLSLHAQDNKQSVRSAFEKIQQAYKTEDPLSFSVRYLYHSPNEQATFNDTVEGRFRVKGGDSWGVFGEAEYICNRDHRITLYPRTGSMVLDKRGDDDAMAMFQLDSFFAKGNEFQLSAPVAGEIALRFQNNPLCDSAFLTYDPHSYRLQTVVYYLKAAGDEALEGNGGKVQMLFSNYSTAPFDESLFSSDRYVQRKGKEYHPAAAFSNYILYLASSKLLN